MRNVIDKYINGLRQLYEKDVAKFEKQMNKKANDYEKELIAENFVRKIINYYKKEMA